MCWCVKTQIFQLKSIAIYGAGGFGKELRGLLHHPGFRDYSFAGFLDDFKSVQPVAKEGGYDDVVVAIANCADRRSIAAKLGSRFDFEKIIHPSVYLDGSIKIKKGSILCDGVKLTVDISIGEFVIVNLNATIGHDVLIEDFVSIMPSVNISGNVTIGKGTFIGTGATVLQGLSIGQNVIIGAGAVVTKNIPDNSIAKGVPARF